MSQTDPRIPVTLLTGFLGSGKTTLLAAVLRRPDRGRVAIVINEFGEVPIDQALVERTDGPLVVLGGGCLCCAIGGDVATTLLDLHRRREELAFDRVIIETSGLADPGPIIVPLLQDPTLTGLFRFEDVTTVIDALQGLRELDRQRVSTKQIVLADRIVLTKSDIAAPRAVSALRERLSRLNPWAPLALAKHGLVEGGWQFEGARRADRPAPDLDEIGRHIHDHDHDDDHDDDHHGFQSVCLWFDQAPDWEPFAAAAQALIDAHDPKILRIKGLLNHADGPVAIHGVGGFLHPPVPLAAWPESDRRSRVVIITERVKEAEVRPFFAPFGLSAAALPPD